MEITLRKSSFKIFLFNYTLTEVNKKKVFGRRRLNLIQLWFIGNRLGPIYFLNIHTHISVKAITFINAWRIFIISLIYLVKSVIYNTSTYKQNNNLLMNYFVLRGFCWKRPFARKFVFTKTIAVGASLLDIFAPRIDQELREYWPHV